MKAKVTWYDSSNDQTIVDVGNHRIQLGGPAGGGYCYAHQSFDCELTHEENLAIDNIDWSEVEDVSCP